MELLITLSVWRKDKDVLFGQYYLYTEGNQSVLLK